MSELLVSLIQTELYWEEAQANRDMLTEKIRSISIPTQLIVLPEAFNSGFSMNAEAIAETMNGDTIRWMKAMARERNAAITGSLFISEEGRYYNRMMWVLPNGQTGYYNKRHLFSLAGEEKTYTPGTQRVIASLNGFRILLQVCYDLRFPVWSRQQDIHEYDVIIYVANWPFQRATAWKTLLQARAIENQSYVIGVNRVGEDGTQKIYSGDSSVINPLGDILYQKEKEEDIFSFTLKKSELEDIRKRFPFYLDRDEFSIED